MDLRKTLDTVFGLLCILLLAAAGSLFALLYLTERTHSAEALAIAQRDSLFQLSYSVRAEELAALETLVGKSAMVQGGPDLAPSAATDAAISRAGAAFAKGQDAEVGKILQTLAQHIAQGRDSLAKAASGPRPASGATLDEWHRSLAPQARDFVQLSQLLAERSPTADSSNGLVPHTLAMLRGLGLNAHRGLLDNRILIERLLAASDPASVPLLFHGLLNSLHATTAASTGAADQAAAHARIAPGPATDPAVQALDMLAEDYAPTELALLDTLAQGRRPVAADIDLWRASSRGSLQEFEHAEAELTATGRDLFDRHVRQTRLTLGTGSLVALLSFCLVAFTAHFLRRTVLHPLDRITVSLRLLDLEGAAPPPATAQDRSDLDRLRATVERIAEANRRDRHRQSELARLSDHAVTGNRHMLADLEAAAAVQRGQLPPSPRALPGAAFHALFRPARIVAGDTYDCVTFPDGRSTVFQIDVAGHGAPAAIVSVAAHVALKQALLSAPAKEPLASTIARVNRTWADDLPYFTLLAVEIDPATASAQIVQCGHPALLRLPAEGGIEAVGKGGLPIGVLPDAAFETLTCPFASGDRLVLTTDGLSEAADPKGRPFGDNRLRDLLLARPRPEPAALFDRIERALWDWRGTDTPDDDVTILILEAR
ncbi:PP2C family protein-serine/threonine phosphatase [Paragemmobacter straminiformis]|uniref:Serine/threonine-protein phosphatase n=1 Tax=Paragemmobacter straminiformis TaxID=2045119 RepID=A0A842ICS4_9RHOB|nr:PP2C family protein-serine/threonine phosphatase [Gemmobacter straminiformis]MBC2837445.1 serine/threonine-protein phosphatase [Gemmobacter straminiformis]